jgi:hypothetical protein
MSIKRVNTFKPCQIDLSDPYDHNTNAYIKRCEQQTYFELDTICCVCKTEIYRFVCSKCLKEYFSTWDSHQKLTCAHLDCLSILETCPVV